MDLDDFLEMISVEFGMNDWRVCPSSKSSVQSQQTLLPLSSSLSPFLLPLLLTFHQSITLVTTLAKDPNGVPIVNQTSIDFLIDSAQKDPTATVNIEAQTPSVVVINNENGTA